jgi:glutamine synthetase
VADELSIFADRLENSDDLSSELSRLLCEKLKEHKRIIYSGNSYSEEWRSEAKSRGLYNLATTPDALAHYSSEKNIALFARHRVLSESEIRSREEILFNNYANTVHIESLTALDMARTEIFPSIVKYQDFLLGEIEKKKRILSDVSLPEEALLRRISEHFSAFYSDLLLLEDNIAKYPSGASAKDKAFYAKDILLANMNRLRKNADTMELLIGRDFLPYPSYEDILYSVKY